MMKRMIPVALLLSAGALTACGDSAALMKDMVPGKQPRVAAAPPTSVQAETAAQARAARPLPSGASSTAEALDTTSKAQRVAAKSAPAASTSERELGRAVASLGDPADPGFWASTRLVDKVTQGRLVDPATGKSAKVELRPGNGGLKVSLAAFRVLGAGLADLPELKVYAQ